MTIEKLRYSHDGMIDLIVANPGVSQNQLASLMGYTPAWVSTVMSSHAFKDRLAERRGELIDPAIAVKLEERFTALAERSLMVLQEKLSLPSNMISDSLALKAAELGAKALGVGGMAPPAPPPVDYLQKLSDRLLVLQEGITGRTITVAAE